MCNLASLPLEISIIIIIYSFFEFFIPALAGGFSQEFE